MEEGGQAGVEGVDPNFQTPSVADGFHLHESYQIPFTSEDFKREIAHVKRKRRRAVVLALLATAVAAVLIVLLVVFRVPDSLCTVSTSSMEPALAQGQVVFVVRSDTLQAGDVAVYRDRDGRVQFKRVVALAGEWANLATDGTIVVSDVPLEDGSVASLLDEGISIVASRQVPVGSYFVLADASEGTAEAIAEFDDDISADQVIGKAAFKVWPPISLSAVR